MTVHPQGSFSFTSMSWDTIHATAPSMKSVPAGSSFRSRWRVTHHAYTPATTIGASVA